MKVNVHVFEVGSIIAINMLKRGIFHKYPIIFWKISNSRMDMDMYEYEFSDSDSNRSRLYPNYLFDTMVLYD